MIENDIFEQNEEFFLNNMTIGKVYQVQQKNGEVYVAITLELIRVKKKQ